MWNLDNFFASWSGYQIRRYANIDTVTYTPSPYVPMPDENYGYARYTLPCLPYMGHKFRYVKDKYNLTIGNTTTNIFKIVVTVPDRQTVHLYKKNENTGVYDDTNISLPIDYTDYSIDTHPYVYVELPTDLTVGDYKAAVEGGSHFTSDDNNSSSRACLFSIQNSDVTKLDDF